MAEVINMPHLSDTMEEGVVSVWHKKVGDTVKSGEILADIETDKATMEFESYYDGVLLHVAVPEGQAAPVDTLLAIIGEKGEDITALLKAAEEQAAGAKEEKSAPAPAPAPAPVETKVAAPAPAVTAAPVVQTAPAPAASNGRIKASPLARRLAKERGIDLRFVRGSGDEGRIVKKDIENYRGGMAPMGVQEERYTEVALSQMRKTIARRLGESKFSAPHFYLTMEVDMDNAMATRTAINKAIAPEKVSFNDLVIKAAAAALRQHPKVNSSWLGDRIRFNEHIHIGVAVAVDEGLLVPVVRFADTKPLRTIGTEVREYAERARAKKLQPADWEGNTFTISNLGMFGIDEFTAIINPPDACILAVGAINEVPVVKNGAIVPGHRMKITLSCDHRAVDGATGAAFLQTLRSMLENPVLALGAASI